MKKRNTFNKRSVSDIRYTERHTHKYTHKYSLSLSLSHTHTHIHTHTHTHTHFIFFLSGVAWCFKLYCTHVFNLNVRTRAHHLFLPQDKFATERKKKEGLISSKKNVKHINLHVFWYLFSTQYVWVVVKTKTVCKCWFDIVFSLS